MKKYCLFGSFCANFLKTIKMADGMEGRVYDDDIAYERPVVMRDQTRFDAVVDEGDGVGEVRGPFDDETLSRSRIDGSDVRPTVRPVTSPKGCSDAAADDVVYVRSVVQLGWGRERPTCP